MSKGWQLSTFFTYELLKPVFKLRYSSFPNLPNLLKGMCISSACLRPSFPAPTFLPKVDFILKARNQNKSLTSYSLRPTVTFAQSEEINMSPQYREVMTGERNNIEKEKAGAKTSLHCHFNLFSKDLSPRKLAHSQGKKDISMSNVDITKGEPYFVPSHGILDKKEQSKQIPSIGIDLQYQDQLPQRGFLIQSKPVFMTSWKK